MITMTSNKSIDFPADSAVAEHILHGINFGLHGMINASIVM